MNRRSIVGAAYSLILATVMVTACTVDGDPRADPAPPPVTTTTTSETDVPTTTMPVPPPPPSLPATQEVPPPPDAQTITCRDYQTRDDPTQVAIVKANGVTKNPFLVATLVGIICRQRPGDTVNFVISNMKDEIIHN